MSVVIQVLIAYFLILVELHDVHDGFLLDIQEHIDDFERILGFFPKRFLLCYVGRCPHVDFTGEVHNPERIFALLFHGFAEVRVIILLEGAGESLQELLHGGLLVGEICTHPDAPVLHLVGATFLMILDNGGDGFPAAAVENFGDIVGVVLGVVVVVVELIVGVVESL